MCMGLMNYRKLKEEKAEKDCKTDDLCKDNTCEYEGILDYSITNDI